MICYTGGATGSDLYWEQSCDRKGIKVVSYSFQGHNSASSIINKVVLSKEELALANDHLFKANQTLKRYLNTTTYYFPLLQRNYYQIKDVTMVLAVGKILEGNRIVDGGTGWAIQMAIDLGNKSIWVFDQDRDLWHIWDYKLKMFVARKLIVNPEQNTPIITTDFAGIGTRNLKINGRLAITDIINLIDLDEE